jgi:hypothetical protein
MPGSPLKVYRSFGGTYRLHPQGLRISQEEISVKQVASVFQRTTRRYIAEDKVLNHQSEKLTSFQYGVTRAQHLDPAQKQYNPFLILIYHFLQINVKVPRLPEFDIVWPVDRCVPSSVKVLFPGRAINKYLQELSLI